MHFYSSCCVLGGWAGSQKLQGRGNVVCTNKQTKNRNGYFSNSVFGCNPSVFSVCLPCRPINKNKPINHLFVVCCSHTLAYRPGGFSTPAYISKKQKHILHSGYSPSFSLIYHSENQSHVLRSFPIWLLQNWKVFRAYNSLLFSLASRGSQRRYFAAALSKGSRARPPARSGSCHTWPR